METNLVVDAEFQSACPSMTEVEFKSLEDNILSCGEVYEPIAVWNGIIVDGYNRYKIIQEHPELIWRTREMQFNSRSEVLRWIYKNQLGRRYLTDGQRAYLLGKLYETHRRRGEIHRNGIES